jgi:anti-sigma B factor antagonist
VSAAHGFYVGGAPLSASTYRISAGGELDLATRPELSAVVEEAIAPEVKELQIDLTEVTFIDSTAIKVIAHAGAEMRARGGQVEVMLGSRNVFRIFEIAGLERLLDLTLSATSPAGIAEPVL